MNRPDLLALREAVRANIQAGADLLSERRMLRLLDALLSPMWPSSDSTEMGTRASYFSPPRIELMPSDLPASWHVCHPDVCGPANPLDNWSA